MTSSLGPVLDSLLLSELGADNEDKSRGTRRGGWQAKISPQVAPPSGHPGEGRHSRGLQRGRAVRWLETAVAAMTSATIERLMDMAFSCGLGVGGGLVEAKGLVAVKITVDHDWEGTRVRQGNVLGEEVRLVRAKPWKA